MHMDSVYQDLQARAIAIRMALGADRAGILGMVLRQGAVVVAARVLLVVATLACALPARRAASTHPTTALADQ